MKVTAALYDEVTIAADEEEFDRILAWRIVANGCRKEHGHRPIHRQDARQRLRQHRGIHSACPRRLPAQSLTSSMTR